MNKKDLEFNRFNKYNKQLTRCLYIVILESILSVLEVLISNNISKGLIVIGFIIGIIIGIYALEFLYQIIRVMKKYVKLSDRYLKEYIFAKIFIVILSIIVGVRIFIFAKNDITIIKNGNSLSEILFIVLEILLYLSSYLCFNSILKSCKIGIIMGYMDKLVLTSRKNKMINTPVDFYKDYKLINDCKVTIWDVTGEDFLENKILLYNNTEKYINFKETGLKRQYSILSTLKFSMVGFKDIYKVKILTTSDKNIDNYKGKVEFK